MFQKRKGGAALGTFYNIPPTAYLIEESQKQLPNPYSAYTHIDTREPQI